MSERLTPSQILATCIERYTRRHKADAPALNECGISHREHGGEVTLRNAGQQTLAAYTYTISHNGKVRFRRLKKPTLETYFQIPMPGSNLHHLNIQAELEHDDCPGIGWRVIDANGSQMAVTVSVQQRLGPGNAATVLRKLAATIEQNPDLLKKGIGADGDVLTDGSIDTSPLSLEDEYDEYGRLHTPEIFGVPEE